MLIVVVLVFGQEPAQMVLVPHESAVQELAAASTDRAFGDRVGSRRQLRLMAMIGTGVCG